MSGENEDSEFYESFKGGMDYLGLPCPETLFGTLTGATASLAAMANYVKTMGTKATFRELVLAFPSLARGASVTAVAGASAEVLGTVAAGATAFYVGCAVGCLVGAAVDVYGTAAMAKLSRWLYEMYCKLGPIDLLITRPRGIALNDSMRKGLDVIRAVGAGSNGHGLRRTVYA
jgi:hypothetical protein